MELGSGSSSSSSSSSSDSLNGLKFGKKIYFEDAAPGVLAKQTPAGTGSTPTESGRPPPAPSGFTAKKGRGGVVPGGQPPRCQVEGCKVDLSDAKAYYSRHKVCGMHSKSPKVIVAGLEQRFCQQCSRFHLLPEFDQGKRSCRRRLAGHNERRRKPPPGTLLSSRYGSLSSSPYFENNSRGGSFLMDFSMYPTLTGRDSWPNTRSTERALGNPQNAAGKFSPHAWQSNPDNNPTTGLLLQGSATRTTYLDSSIPSGECFAGVSDSSRALSLLSTQPWCSRNHRSSSLGVNGFINSSGTPMVHSSGEGINQFSSPLWGFKGDESSSTSHGIPPDLGLGQISHPDSSGHYAGDLDLAQQNGREYLGLDHSRAYDSSVQNMHWSL